MSSRLFNMFIIIVSINCLFVSVIYSKDVGKSKKEKQKKENRGPKIRKNKDPGFFNTVTKIKNPLALRDPFKKKSSKSKGKRSWTTGYLEKKKGYFSNVAEISNVSLSNIYVVGILTGKQRRALIKIGKDPKSLSKETYVLKEGMKLGEDESELKAILPGGIVLAQKIKNIYNQDEYLETVIPLIRPQ